MTSDFTRSLTSTEYKFVRPYFAPRPAGMIPSAGILDNPTYVLAINAEWLPHLLGALSVLDQSDAWQGTESEIEQARSEVNALITAIVGA